MAGTVAFLVVYAATAGDGTEDSFVAQIAETLAPPQADEPFRGGPRLFFPVAGVDLDRVPFNTVVSHAFDLVNLGDAPLRLEDVQVKTLEGC